MHEGCTQAAAALLSVCFQRSRCAQCWHHLKLLAPAALWLLQASTGMTNETQVSLWWASRLGADVATKHELNLHHGPAGVVLCRLHAVCACKMK